MKGAPSPFMGGRCLSDVYVEPDVLVAELSSPHERVEREDDLPALGYEAADVGEEEVRRVSERRVPWWQALADLEAGAHRVVVLEGPPGGGKSTMLAMAARAIARRSAAAVRGGASAAEVELPFLVHLPDLVANAELDAEAALASMIGSPAAAQVHERRAWLLLDALDEVPDAGAPALARLLQEAADWQSRVVVATRPAGRMAALPFASRIEARVAPLAPHQVEAFLDRRGGLGAEQVRRAMAEGGPLAELAQNPFLLTAACWVADHGKLPAVPTRSAFYARLVGDLLAQREWRPVDYARRDASLPALGDAARELLARHGSVALVPHGELRELLAASPHRPSPAGLDATQSASLTPLQQADYLLREFEAKRLLAPLSARRDLWAAPHRSILEFAAGVGLAQVLRGSEEAWGLIDDLGLRPGADEPIAFCAGALAGECGGGLADATALRTLLALLADDKRDDWFRHRLALAARCLAEVPMSGLDAMPKVVDRITTEAFSLWWRFSERGTEAAIPHIQATMPSLGRANGRLRGTPLLDHLARNFGR